MTQDEARARNVEYLMLNAEQSLESAKAESGIGQAGVFVAEMKRLLGERSRNPPAPPR